MIPKELRKAEGALSRELSDKLNVSGEEGDVDKALKPVGDIDVKTKGGRGCGGERQGWPGGWNEVCHMRGKTSRATWPPRSFSLEGTRMSSSRLR